MVIRGHQRSSEAIRGHQRPSEAISGHQRSLAAHPKEEWWLRRLGLQAELRQSADVERGAAQPKQMHVEQPERAQGCLSAAAQICVAAELAVDANGHRGLL